MLSFGPGRAAKDIALIFHPNQTAQGALPSNRRLECKGVYQPKGILVNKVYFPSQYTSHHLKNTPGPLTVRSAIPMDSTEEIKLIRMLLEHLERICGFILGTRASGIRGGLLERMEELEKGTPAGQANTNKLISSAIEILTRAAREKR